MNILIVSSSLNPESLSENVCKETKKLLEQAGSNIDFINLKDLELVHNFAGTSKDADEMKKRVEQADAVIFGMAVYCYSVNNSLKTFLDTMFKPSKEYTLFGIISAAGSDRSYLATAHLTQICQQEWRMMTFPRTFYCTHKDFEEGKLNEDMQDRLKEFAHDFYDIAKKLN